MHTLAIRCHVVAALGAALLLIAACGGDDANAASELDSGLRGDDASTHGRGEPAVSDQRPNGSASAGRGAGSLGAAADAPGGGAGGSVFPAADAGVPVPMCREDPPDAAVTCSGQECPASTGFNRCRYPCCATVDGEAVCGTRNTAMNAASDECVATPATDTRCPGAEYQGATLPGCCTADNLCGIVSRISNTCVTESRFVELPATPQRCDGSAAGDDAGADAQDDGGLD